MIYVSKPGEPEPPLGPYLGELTDELNGDHIITFVSGGPKNYAYRTNTDKVETKIRGITLNCTARQTVNFNVIQELVHLYVAGEPRNKSLLIFPTRLQESRRQKAWLPNVRKKIIVLFITNVLL